MSCHISAPVRSIGPLVNTLIAVIMGLLVLAFAMFVAVKSGFARWLFFETYAWVRGDEVLGPSLVYNPPINSPYQRWLADTRDEWPLNEGPVLHDVENIPLHPWAQMGDGIEGLYLHFANYQMLDARIIEIPSQGEMKTQRHLYESGVYILRGSGNTRLQQEDKADQTINWEAGDLFSIPLNVRYRHRNSGDKPARLLLVTTFPLMLNLIDDEDFITDNPAVFAKRYDADHDYLETTSELARLELAANFVRDIRTTPARENDFRGQGNQSIRWKMAGNTALDMHISEMPPRMMKKAHRITSNAFVLVLAGTGCTVLWREGLYRQRKRVDWQPGTLFVPPVFWYQQHLNYGRTPARYLAINVPGLIRNLGLHFEDQLEADITAVKAEWKKELEKKSSQQP